MYRYWNPRPPESSEHEKSPTTSKSPRRTTEAARARGSLAADQRLDQLIADSNREKMPGGGAPKLGANLVGSPAQSPIVPQWLFK